MPVITIISDWNRGDFYLSAMKGKIISNLPGVQLVDISHGISSFDYVRAAYIMRNTYRTFPKGTVHIICVDSEKKPQSPHIVVKHDNHYFIGAYNDVMKHIFIAPAREVWVLEHDLNTVFADYEVFADVAVYLAQGGNVENLGTKWDITLEAHLQLPRIDSNSMEGNPVYIDSYGNAITNISLEDFTRVGKNRPFELYVLNKRYTLNKISKGYYEAKDGELLALFNSSGWLELALYRGNLAEMFNLSNKTPVIINFFDKTEENQLILN
ncbi:MAG TPA: SAM-dependent chlorinase/fluorinase [Bacteroidales bacterium]|nr:SAM-dependent chlorinase/fluorinase [Bacteroidales bacterium]